MRGSMKSFHLFCILGIFSISGCSPETLGGRQQPCPSYEGVPTVLVDAYITRVFIDLIGREPL